MTEENCTQAESGEESEESYKIPEKFETLELGAWEDKVPDTKVTTFEEVPTFVFLDFVQLIAKCFISKSVFTKLQSL